MSEHHARSFAPIATRHARVLILGTMPSQRSLARQQYYGHPQNAFWPIMADLLGFEADASYTQRRRALTRHGVAVWDVLASCVRPGSLDASIEEDSIAVNDIGGFLRTHRAVRAVFFNGTKSEQLFKRYVLTDLGDLDERLYLQRLPSTSPAHAALTRAQKRQAWREILSWSAA